MKLPLSPPRVVVVSVLALWAVGCAFDLSHVKQTPAALATAPSGGSRWRLVSDANISIGTGYATRLKAGTQWEQVGRLAQGDVFKTHDQILTVEASNIHEAYLVVRDKMVTGFYLPVERTFTPVNPPQPIQTEP